jgi:hypothetical protein
MAEGLKAWAANFYNKTQAYLYEAQKADDHTKPWGSPRSISILGVDTDANPDLEVHTLPDKGVWQSRAVELKASTSADYKAVDKLVKDGLEQLKKREGQHDAYNQPFKRLLLTVHNDSPANPYPMTPTEFETRYASIWEDVKWNDEKERLVDRIEEYDFQTEVEVRLEHGGTRYVTAIYKP